MAVEPRYAPAQQRGLQPAVERAGKSENLPARAGTASSPVMRVRYFCLIEEGILDGDRVVVEAREDARDGELVVALVDGAEAALKRLERKAGRIVLHPANAALAPME